MLYKNKLPNPFLDALFVVAFVAFLKNILYSRKFVPYVGKMPQQEQNTKATASAQPGTTMGSPSSRQPFRTQRASEVSPGGLSTRELTRSDRPQTHQIGREARPSNHAFHRRPYVEYVSREAPTRVSKSGGWRPPPVEKVREKVTACDAFLRRNERFGLHQSAYSFKLKL